MKIHMDLKQLTKENEAFRRVLETGKYSQVVVMSIPKGERIGEETHEKTDQIFYFVEGRAEVVVNGKLESVEKNEIVFIPAGTKHDIRNVGQDSLKLFTVYAPAKHPAGLVQKTKNEESATVRR